MPNAHNGLIRLVIRLIMAGWVSLSGNSLVDSRKNLSHYRHKDTQFVRLRFDGHNDLVFLLQTECPRVVW